MTRTTKWMLALLVLSAPLARADKKQLQPGEWEISVQMELEGSSMQLPPQTTRRCVTPEEAQKPGPLFRPSSHHTEECQIKEEKHDGNKYTWTFDCGLKGKGSGTVTYEPGKWDGSSRMELMDKTGVLHRMKSTMSGRRLGDCK